jgi:hypothetical protein
MVLKIGIRSCLHHLVDDIYPTVRYESNGEVGEARSHRKEPSLVKTLYQSLDESLNLIYGNRYGNLKFIVYGL